MPHFVDDQSVSVARYVRFSEQIRTLLGHVKVEGRVFDRCDSTDDAVSKILEERGCKVTTNYAHRLRV